MIDTSVKLPPAEVAALPMYALEHVTDIDARGWEGEAQGAELTGGSDNRAAVMTFN